MKPLLQLVVLLLLSTIAIQAQNFNDYFINKSLRLDYAFSGDATSTHVTLDGLNQLPEWAGRRTNLSKLCREGNGQIHVYDSESRTLIYKEAFSSLFQEWQTIDEAETLKKSFENTFLIPFPKKKVEIEICMRNKKGEYITTLKHIVDPSDILIRKVGLKNIPNYTYVHKGGATDKAINVVIIAEGYTKEEMSKFKADAQITCDAMFEHSVFGRFKNKFNFIAVETISEDSGVSVPKENQWKSTAFSSHFDTFYSERYLTSSRVRDIHNTIAGIPYAHIIILANTPVYGGGGILNSYTLTTTGHPDFRPVVVHEFGHSFGGLADEYFYIGDTFDDTYPLSVEPWEPNITTLIKFEDKWKDMLSSNTPIPTPLVESDKYKVSVIEGAGYSPKGVYRPNADCRMKTNTCKDFCPVCQRALERLIKFYTE